MSHTAEEDRFSFAPFTRHCFFTQVNRWLVDRVIAPGHRVIVDLGCGPGGVTQLILDRLRDVEPKPQVIGVDPSPSAIARARAAISARFVEFVQGSAEWLSKLIRSADVVVFLNAIHLVPDKARVLSEIRRVLNPGGVLAFNSSFFAGAYPEGTGSFWRRWIVRSVQALKERGIAVRHTHADKATAMDWLTPDQYRDLCRAAGLEPTTMELVQAEMTRESLADLGRFSLFIEGALPGVPIEQAAEALQVGLARTLDELNIEKLPRNWLEVVAKAV